MTKFSAVRRKLAELHRHCAPAIQYARAKSVTVLFDLVLVAGGAVFSYGMHLAWRPLGFISAGILLIIFALYAAPVDKGRA